MGLQHLGVSLSEDGSAKRRRGRRGRRRRPRRGINPPWIMAGAPKQRTSKEHYPGLT